MDESISQAVRARITYRDAPLINKYEFFLYDFGGGTFQDFISCLALLYNVVHLFLLRPISSRPAREGGKVTRPEFGLLSWARLFKKMSTRSYKRIWLFSLKGPSSRFQQSTKALSE